MLYICIPTYNEAPTIGVLLWRIRKVFQDYTREYEIVVYDDASTDDTLEVLEPYKRSLPLRVISGNSHIGYAGSVRALLKDASRRTRYPRRDALILMQADFTDQPEGILELNRRFEGGADIVVSERLFPESAPRGLKRLHTLTTKWLPRIWPIRSAVTVPGVPDPYGGFRLMRITVVRDLLRSAGQNPVSAASDPWQVNLDLIRAALPHSRRVESVQLTQRYDIRQRDSRRDPWPDAWGLVKAAWTDKRTASVAKPS